MNFKHLAIPLITLLVVMCALFPAYGQQRGVSEYQVKAAFLYNFAKFVDWPICNDCTPSEFLVLGILGKDPFGDEINSIDGKRVKNKTLRVIRSDNLDELQNSNIIFISASAKSDLPRILRKLQGKPILTIGDTKGFAESGIMINLFNFKNKIRFEINSAAAEQSGLKISSQLLKLAIIIKPEDS